MTVSMPVDAEQAWKDLQRIRVPQERVYDEYERSASGGRGMTYGTAALMWVFLAGVGMDLPGWGVGLFLGAYVGLLSVLIVMNSRRSRMQLHHTRCTGRMWVTFGAAGVLVGGTIVLADHLTKPLGPLYAGLIQATVAVAVYLLFLGPANRWAAESVRSGGEPAVADEEAGR
ncbi:hypothetical protein ACWGHM_00255 [Streptomyces sp. NPDC054904]|uniref:hypothetical protein n=1 Tax=unclassified Streptomyces TaxID=2593676 RepID=UPI002481F318|nr:hypothetical protein [Streptomyces sp. Isolate_45]MDA5282758.1 hypothetical protein [Streptomyces sp. Isolate_45]